MNVEQTGRLLARAAVHAALADPTRLRIVDVLAVGDASASELGARLDVPSNLLAHHVKVLESAGLLVRQRSEGDARRSYLTLRPERVPAVTGADVPHLPHLPSPRRVLFVCTANTARSHLAAALWRRASPVGTASAGTEPGERIHERAVAAAARHGLDLPAVAPARLEDVAREGDLVITVCDRAHEQLRGADWAHWSIPDPVGVRGRGAFDRTIERLDARIGALAPRLVRTG